MKIALLFSGLWFVGQTAGGHAHGLLSLLHSMLTLASYWGRRKEDYVAQGVELAEPGTVQGNGEILEVDSYQDPIPLYQLRPSTKSPWINTSKRAPRRRAVGVQAAYGEVNKTLLVLLCLHHSMYHCIKHASGGIVLGSKQGGFKEDHELVAFQTVMPVMPFLGWE